ncbi:MAG TPA: hypothetical protein VHN37_06370 [Actinomycetota bacterium]|nr:hypothetical protein [Actinomycetota bacterium]
MGATVSTRFDVAYVAARRVLLDALEALQPHLDALVVVGAQAVYLRTHRLELGVAPYTTDGDLVIDPRHLSTEPDLGTALRAAGFELATDARGNTQPGMWTSSSVPLDLLVPSGMSAARRRSARLDGHERAAARTVAGLEATLLDHDPMVIASLDGADRRASTVEVAGPVALLIAKAYKISERARRGARPDRVHAKDAGDAYRLMQATDVAASIGVARRLVDDPDHGHACAEGLRHLVDLFRGRRTVGTELAIDHFRTALPAERVAAIATSYVRRLDEGLSAAPA